jgi:hypothetical protein
MHLRKFNGELVQVNSTELYVTARHRIVYNFNSTATIDIKNKIKHLPRITDRYVRVTSHFHKCVVLQQAIALPSVLIYHYCIHIYGAHEHYIGAISVPVSHPTSSRSKETPRNSVDHRMVHRIQKTFPLCSRMATLLDNRGPFVRAVIVYHL